MKRRNLSWLPWIKHSRLWTGYKWAPQIGNSSPLPSFPSSCLLGGCMRSGWNKHPLVTRVSYANMSYNGRSKIISPFFLYRKKNDMTLYSVCRVIFNNILFIFLGSLEIAGDYNHNQVSSSLWSFFLLLPRNIRFSWKSCGIQQPKQYLCCDIHPRWGKYTLKPGCCLRLVTGVSC